MRTNQHPASFILHPSQVVADRAELIAYEVDGGLDRGRPDLVLFPESAEDVVKAVRWAVAEGKPIVARGAGTGLSGGAVAEQGGVIVQCSRLQAVRDMSVAGRAVTVEPGLVNLTLDALAKSKGLYYPPDPASGRSATLGGNIAENSGGPHCFKYGVTANYVTGLEVVLADGRQVRLGGRAYDYPEYDLNALVCGSEGTLALVTAAHLRLLANPPAVKTMMAAFASVEAAGEAVSAVIAAGLIPATLEMMDTQIMRIINQFTSANLPEEAGAALIIEADGYPSSVGPQIDEAEAILRAHGGFALRVARTAEERDTIWYGRKSAVGAMTRLAPAYYLIDVTVPRSKLAPMLAGVNQICHDLDLQVGYVFHAGDGNLHPLILIHNPRDQALMERVHRAGRRIVELGVRFDGSITGEHGVGIEKREYMPLMYSPAELAVMRDIKAVFDPEERLNPGKIFPRDEGGGMRDESAPSLSADSPALSGLHPSSLILHPATPEEAAALLAATAGQGHTVYISNAGGPHPQPPLPLAQPTEAGAAEAKAPPAPVAVGHGSGGQGAEDREASPRHPESALNGGGDARIHPSSFILQTSSLTGVRALARDDLYVTVGAGTTVADLQAELVAERMWVPVVATHPAVTVGGLVATNANAPLRMRYGGLRDLVLAVTVALPDGRLIRAGRPVVKNVAGYDLPKLFVGSYGTLGLITDVTLKLAPLPRCRQSLVAPVATLREGFTMGASLLPACLVASSLLICDARAAGLPALSAPYALVYTAEGLAADVEAELAAVEQTLHRAGVRALPALEGSSGSQVWADWLGAAIGADAPTLRLGVAPESLPALALGDLGGFANLPGLPSAEGSLAADLASGLLYLRGPADPQAAYAAAIRLGGYGLALAGVPDPSARWGHAAEALDLMRALRGRWNPGDRLNPGMCLV